MENLYEAGAVRNIAAFHQNVVEGRCQNETAKRAVDGALTCILGREAAARRRDGYTSLGQPAQSLKHLP